MRLAALLVFALCYGPLAVAAPLTLEAALRTVGSGHPDEVLAQADQAASEADVMAGAARQDWLVTLDGALRQGQQPFNSGQWSDDHLLRLNARYPLLDFGRTAGQLRAAEAERDARVALVTASRDQRRLEIMQRFFAVLLADVQYAADNEYMAVLYVTYDQARDRLQQGQVSRVEVAEAESRYQDSLQKRNASQIQQRVTRARLAEAMNQPGRLAADLAEPPVNPLWQKKLPDATELQAVAEQHNLRLQALRQQLAAAEARLASVRAERNPQLDVELQAADYSRTAVTRDNLSAGVVLTIPLWQGRRVDARLAREQAQFQRLQAMQAKLQMELQQSVLETALQIEQLQQVAQGAAEKHAQYRDLALEKSRGLYELELKANIGTAMADVMQANLRSKQVQYDLALAWERLRALLGTERYPGD